MSECVHRLKCDRMGEDGERERATEYFIYDRNQHENSFRKSHLFGSTRSFLSFFSFFVEWILFYYFDDSKWTEWIAVYALMRSFCKQMWNNLNSWETAHTKKMLHERQEIDKNSFRSLKRRRRRTIELVRILYGLYIVHRICRFMNKQ